MFKWQAWSKSGSGAEESILYNLVQRIILFNKHPVSSR